MTNRTHNQENKTVAPKTKISEELINAFMIQWRGFNKLDEVGRRQLLAVGAQLLQARYLSDIKIAVNKIVKAVADEDGDTLVAAVREVTNENGELIPTLQRIADALPAG